MSESFRLFLYENTQGAWFEKIPMPESVGNALMVANQYASNYQSSLQESYGEVIPGRGFPLSKSATDLLSIVPSKKGATKKGESEIGNLGPMVHTFDWLVTRGLFESLKIRQQMAEQATKDLLNQMGEQKFRQAFQIGPNDPPAVTEDVVYNKKAHQAIPELGQWFNEQDPSAMEPTSQIKIPVGKGWQKISVKDINNVVDILNQQQKAVKLNKFNFAGPGGFIEWIEDGSWAEPIGQEMKQPWRTKHGISLHNPQARKDPDTGQLVFKMGGIVSPLRNLEGSYQKKVRSYVQGIVADTARAVQGKVDRSQLSPEDTEWLDNLINVYEGKSTMSYNFGTFAGSRGYTQRDNIDFDPENAADYAAHVLMMRMAIDMRANVNDYLDQTNDSPSAINHIKNVYNLGDKELNQIRGKESNRINSQNKDRFYKAFGVDQGNDNWKSGRARIKLGTTDLRASSMLTFGWEYMKHLLNKGKTVGDLVNRYLGKELASGMLGNVSQEDIEQELTSIAQEAGSSKVPQLKIDGKPIDLKTKFGSEVNNKSTLNSDQVSDLLQKGWQFQPDRGQPDDIEAATSGKLVSDTGMKALSRKTNRDNWDVIDTDSDGQPLDRYSTDVPLLFPSKNVRFGTDKVFAGKSAIGTKQTTDNMKTILSDMEENPQEYGYGLGGAESIDQQMYELAKRLSRSSEVYNSEFASFDPHDLAFQLKAKVTERLGSKMLLKYGNLGDKIYIDSIVVKSLTNAGIDPASARFWVSRMQKYWQSGNIPIVKDNGDLSAQAWQNTEGIPVSVNNAFLMAGSKNREREAVRGVRMDIKRNSHERQSIVGTGKEGEEMDMMAQVASGGNDAETRMAAAVAKSGVANNLRNRVGIDSEDGFKDGEEVAFKQSEGIKQAPFRNNRKQEDNGRYVHAYRQMDLNVSNAGPDQLLSSLRSIKSDQNAQGRLDAIADRFATLLQSKFRALGDNTNIPNLRDQVAPLYMSIGIPLERKYKELGDGTNILSVLKTVIPSPKLNLMVNMANVLHQSDMELKQQQYAQAGQQYARAAMGVKQPEEPKAKLSMRDFMKKTPNEKQENYSFKNRYERKLAEGDAIYDKSKPTTFNWEGSVGKPGGKVIDGEVNERKPKNKQ